MVYDTLLGKVWYRKLASDEAMTLTNDEVIALREFIKWHYIPADNVVLTKFVRALMNHVVVTSDDDRELYDKERPHPDHEWMVEKPKKHANNCPAYGNYQPPYEECTCGFGL